MKSQVNGFLEVASGIFQDLRSVYPKDAEQFSRDWKTLTRLVECRGLGFITLDLPSFDNQLLAGLESGLLAAKDRRVRSKQCRVPRLFSGLYLRIFDKACRLRSDADVTAIKFLRQLYCLGKKIEIPCSKKRQRLAIKEFCNVEQQMRPPTLCWGADTLSLDGDRKFLHLRDCVDADLPLFPEQGIRNDQLLLLDRCQRIFDDIAKRIGPYYPDEVVDFRQGTGATLGLSHGPGAVAERRGRYFNKYAFPSWTAKLQRLFPFEYFGRMPNDPKGSPSLHEAPAYLHLVPKSRKGPRIIAAEPTSHMWCQKLTESFLKERVKDTVLGSFINFKRQDLSGKLVIGASLDRKLATIDLSSASDRLSCWLVERAFRKNESLLDAFHASRTRWVYIPQLGEYIKLRKFASQGTALTFPVQSLIFLGIALAVSLDGPPTDKNLRGLRNRVRVYGDDIIIPTDRYADAVTLMTLLGLKVNSEKSFHNGHFRESCGFDYFRGHDVTPVKPKGLAPTNPASCQMMLDTSNNLFYKGFWYGSDIIKHRLDRASLTRFPIVGRDAGATGYGSYTATTFVSAFLSSYNPSASENCKVPRRIFGYKSRWNSSLQRLELRVPTLRSGSKVRPYDCGYTGIFARSCAPRNDGPLNGVLSVLGIPARPHLKLQMRWEALYQFI